MLPRLADVFDINMWVVEPELAVIEDAMEEEKGF